jgi:hypothetical protein
MNAARIGLVCLSLGVLLGIMSFVPEWVPERERPTRDGDDQPATVPDVIRRRILAKIHLVEELAADRISLIEAAALFRDLDRVPPETNYSTVPDPDPPLRLTTPTEDERYCEVVIRVARNNLRVSQPDRAEAVIAHLVSEFEAERCLKGTIRLPNPESLEPAHELLRRCVSEGK